MWGRVNGMDVRVTALCRANPWMDELMAETLVKMDDQGKLEGYMDAYVPPKISVDTITECEEQSRSTSLSIQA